MAITQYIGSRYVPLLADPVEWSAAKEYEPLTIVTHEGNSYTSRQFVPVGIDIDNGEFWAITGNYNEQIDQYRRDVKSVMKLLPSDSFSAADTVKNYIDSKVQTGIETIEGIIDVIGAYVTPESFGAKGDGIADDTTAWQAAVDTGKPILALHKKYKCDTININSNTILNCNGATFICTSNILFNCSGEVIQNILNQPNYEANQLDYKIQGVYNNYTGFAFMRGTNNWEPCRSYYRGGFACSFNNGTMLERYPISVTGVSIALINPITVNISNIEDVIYSNTVDYTFNVIKIQYGLNCIIKNCHFTTDAKAGINLTDCYKCSIIDVVYKRNHSVFPNDNYLIALFNSSYCNIDRCYLYNYNWHCVTTGDTYLCFKNNVLNSVLLNQTGLAYMDHENALGTTIANCVVTSMHVTALCTIENVVILQESLMPNTSCLLRISPSSIKENGIYNINNVTFIANDEVSSSYFGIWMTKSFQVSGNTYYLTNVNISNVYTTNTQVKCVIRCHGGPADNNFVLGTYDIRNTNLDIYTIHSSFLANHDITNFILLVSDSNVTIGYNQLYTGNIIKVSNCIITGGFGNCKELYVYNTACEPSAACTIESLFLASNMKGRLRPAAVTNTTKVIVTGIDASNSNRSIISISKGEDGNLYYTFVNNNGVLTTVQLTS